MKGKMTALFSGLFFLVSSLLLFFSTGEAVSHGAGSSKATMADKEISTDVVWKGEIVVNGTVTVTKDATLTVAAGSTVKFVEGAGLLVRGKMIAVGEPDKVITFTALEKKLPAAWDMVTLDSSTAGSLFAHCVFEYATWGLHGDFSHMQVKDCLFRNNEGGLKFMSGFVEIRQSLFIGNKIGIRWRTANGLIENNVIMKNEIGFFVKEKGGKLTVKNNDVFDNSSYNIRVGDFVDSDVNAQQNWWGQGNPADKIYDGKKEKGLGKVLYEPYLDKPVNPVTPKAK